MNAIVMYLFALFKNCISIFTNMCTRASSKSDPDISSSSKDITRKNEINFKEFSYKWKISNYLNKSLYYSTNSLKLIFCKDCNYNITTNHWHCFNDDIYCNICYYKIPLVKKMMIR
jgi:hypothetical protein